MTPGIVRNPARLNNMRNEISRVGGFSPECGDYLRDQQLDFADVVRWAGLFTVALAKFYRDNTGDNTFIIDADGVPTAIIEALLFDHDRQQVAVDYVAWPLADPESFATAMGLNDGADHLGPQNLIKRLGKPLMIHRTPLRWLQAGGTGCVPLKPKSIKAGVWLARAGGPFIVEDVEHGREVRTMLGAAAGRHQIFVPQGEARRTAA